MAKYLLAYRGGGMGESPEEQQEIMGQWMSWFGQLGDAVVDAGSPFGPSSTLESGGGVHEGGQSSLTGYSIVSAESIDDAVSKAKGCPILSTGGTLEVYESLPIG
jgi:hypothetical protein